MSYQVKKDVINHLENLIKDYFTKKESHSLQHYSTQDNTKHSPCDLQNQQNPYPIFRDNQEFISLKSSFARINNDIQEQIKQFQDIADKYENTYQYSPLQYNFEENKNNFKKILSLRRSLETKTHEALDKIRSLVNYRFIDYETYYNSDKEIKDGLLKFKKDFQYTTFQIFKGLIQTYYSYSDADQYDKTRNQDTKLEILKNLYEINNSINTNKSLFDEGTKNICDKQFNYAIQDFVKNNCETNLYRLNTYEDSSEFNFNNFMKEKIREFKRKFPSSPSTSLGSPYNSSRPVSPAPYRP